MPNYFSKFQFGNFRPSIPHLRLYNTERLVLFQFLKMTDRSINSSLTTHKFTDTLILSKQTEAFFIYWLVQIFMSQCVQCHKQNIILSPGPTNYLFLDISLGKDSIKNPSSFYY